MPIWVGECQTHWAIVAGLSESGVPLRHVEVGSLPS